MHDSWHGAETAVAASLPNGQDPQLISLAWRVRNLSEMQATANGNSAILGPEVAVATHSRKNKEQEDRVETFSNQDVERSKTGEQNYDKMAMSSFSLQSPSLPHPHNNHNHNDFVYSIGSPFASQIAGSIPYRQMTDETEAGNQLPPDDALPVATGTRGISYADGHMTGSAVIVGDEKSGYMNLRHKSIRKPVQERPRPKRQAARDMCRPLKQWLYCHRDTPYPTKAEKQNLALVSRMTLTQVSNWFANARRRLKNTVSGGAEVTWRRRIKLYNQFVVGNQELLSISSDDTMWDEEDDEEEEEQELEEGRMDGRGKEDDESRGRLTVAHQMSLLTSSFRTGDEPEPTGRRHRLPPLTFDPEAEDLSSPATSPPSGACTPAKFKQGILQRYLTDACERVGQKRVEEAGEETEGEGGGMQEREATERRRHRNGSGSLSSHDYEEISLSARSTPTKEHQTSEDDIAEDRSHRNASSKLSQSNDLDDLHWMEISAALALTSLAMRSRLNSGSSRASSRM